MPHTSISPGPNATPTASSAGTGPLSSSPVRGVPQPATRVPHVPTGQDGASPRRASVSGGPWRWPQGPTCPCQTHCLESAASGEPLKSLLRQHSVPQHPVWRGGGPCSTPLMSRGLRSVLQTALTMRLQRWGCFCRDHACQRSCDLWKYWNCSWKLESRSSWCCSI